MLGLCVKSQFLYLNYRYAMKNMQMKWYIVCDFLQNDTWGREVGWNNDES